MNVLHLSRTMGQGGAEKVVVDLCENTREKFDKIVVLSTGGFQVKKLEKYGIHHKIIPDLESKNILDMITTIMILFKTIKNYDINIIHTHHRMGAFYAQIIKIFNKKIRLVYTAHNVFYNKRLLTKLSLRKTSIIAVGQGVKRNLVDFYSIPVNKIKVITNSIKLDNRKFSAIPVECDESKTVISCIGRLSEQKGIEFLIKAIEKVIKKDKQINILVLIIGDGEKKEELLNLTQELSLERYIKFLGYRSNVDEYMHFSKFVVNSSLWEGFPLTLIECFSQGKTVVASNIAGNNEIIENNYNGMLFKSKDVDELSSVIIKLIKNEEFLEYLSRNAKDTYLSKFSFEKYIKDYIEFYNKLIE